jgi:hypothetical protein
MKTIIKLFSGLMFLLFAQASFATLSTFNGTWVNVNSNTRGLTKLIINATNPEHISVNAWGQCHPTDCAWGLKKGVAFGPSVSANILSTAGALISVYEFSHAMTTVVLKPIGSTRLEVETFTEFAAGDSRSDYFKRYIFKKAPRSIINRRPIIVRPNR